MTGAVCRSPRRATGLLRLGVLASLAVGVPGGREVAGAPAGLSAARSARSTPSGDSLRVDTIAPGVVHRRIVRAGGPWRIHVITVPLTGVRAGGYRLAVARAGGTLRGWEPTTALARRAAAAAGATAVAAINGDFWDAAGANEGNLVVRGRVLHGVQVADSRFGTHPAARGQFGVARDGRVFFERLAFAGTLVVRSRGGVAHAYALDGLNAVPRVPDALVLYTPAFGDAPRADSAHAQWWAGGERMRTDTALARTLFGAVEVPLARVAPQRGPARDGEDLQEGVRFRVAGAPRPVGGGGPVPPDGAVLVAYGAARARLDTILTAGGTVSARAAFRPDRGALAALVGGWPLLVREGRNIAGAAAATEGTFPEFAAERFARSAVAVTRDRATLLLVTVDGQPERGPAGSVGMTLAEFADLLVSLGARDALNLDGGGSTTLVAAGRVVNVPTAPAGERPVGSALVVIGGAGHRGRAAPR